MATYKVLQDIEADDKLLGPLSLKQFIFAVVFVGLGFVQFLIATSPAPAANYWFMNQAAPAPQLPLPPDLAVFDTQQVVMPGTTDVHPAAEETAAEHELAEKLKHDKNGAYEQYNEHMKTIQPLHDRDGRTIAREEQPEPHLNPVDPLAVLAGMPVVSDDNVAATPQNSPQDQTQKQVNPAILGLAHNDDLNVATIARQAKRMTEDDGEVVISLH